MSTSERSIPHLRDIFSLSGYSVHHHSPNNGDCNGALNGNIAIESYPDIKGHQKKKRDNSKTLTSGDVKTLERHLSMKKTIRKKIMRDLQQAFVEDPNEFKVENSSSEQLKAEIRAEALRFGEKPTRKSDNFLDMLRGEKTNFDYSPKTSPCNDFSFGNQTPHNEKSSFWRRFALKSKTKR